MKKKIVTLLIVITMLCGILPVGNNPVYAADYSDSLALIKDLGIISEGEALTFGNEYMTRNIFADKLFSLYKLDLNSLAYPEKVFYDVGPDDTSYVSIMYLYNSGIMRGYEDGSFKPDYFITGIEAVVSFINLLGYSYKAAAEGGYPSGYLSVAKSIGLTKGLSSFDYSYKLSGKELAKLIDNALSIPLVRLTAVGDNKTYEASPDSTILSLYFKMGKETGVITANEFISIKGDKAGEDAVIVNGKQYIYDDIFVSQLVGRRVTIIYDNINESIHNIVNISVSGNDSSQVFDIRDYVASTSSHFIFDEDGKEAEIKTSVDAQVFYNNSELTLSGSLMDFIKSINDGSIRFVSTDESNKYDVIFITEIKYYVADRINGEKFTVYDKINKSSYIELDDTKAKISITDESGKPMEFSQIEEGSILEVLEGIGCKYVTVVNKIIAGVLESRISEEKYSIYTISGAEYKIASDKAGIYEAIATGSNIKLYMSSLNEIIHIEKTGADGYTPAYLIKIGEKTVDNEKVLVGKFFDVNGKINVYDFKKNFKINNTPTGEYLTLNELTALLNKYNENTNQFSLIKLNEENKVSSIYLARAKDELLKGNDDGLCLQHPVKELTFLSGPLCFSYKVHANSLATPIMIIPKNIESADERDFKIVDNSYLYNGMKSLVESYAYSKYSIGDDIIILYSDDTLVQEIDEYERPVVILSKTTAVTEDEETVTRFRVTDGTDEFYFDVENDTKLKTKSKFDGVEKEYTPFDLSKGDIIIYIADSNNFLTSFEYYYDADNEKFYEKNTKELIGNGLLLRTVEAIDNSWIAFLHGQYSLTPTDYIKFNITGKSVVGHVITIDKSENGNIFIENSDMKDIFVGDTVVFQLAGNLIYSIIVIK